LARRAIDDGFGQRDRDRVAYRAVLAGDVLVGEDDVHLRAVLLVLVRTAGEVDHLVAFDAAGARIDRVRPDGGQVVEVEGEDFPAFRASHANFDPVLARVNVR